MDTAKLIIGDFVRPVENIPGDPCEIFLIKQVQMDVGISLRETLGFPPLTEAEKKSAYKKIEVSNTVYQDPTARGVIVSTNGNEEFAVEWFIQGNPRLRHAWWRPSELLLVDKDETARLKELIRISKWRKRTCTHPLKVKQIIRILKKYKY